MLLDNDPVKIRELFRLFFEDIFSHEHLKKGFGNIDKVIEIVYKSPDMKFVIDCNKGNVRFIPDADGEFKPDVTIKMDWSTAHNFWMGDLDPITALFSQRITVSGDAAALLDLKPLFRETSAIYKKVYNREFGDLNS